jgi:type III pantothenate kinase
MILDIDVGNTRVKWRAGRVRGSCARTDIHSMLAANLPERPDRIRVASVAGMHFNQELSTALRDAFAVDPEFARTTSRVGQVTCGYESPATMGVDRWLAVLAAWQRTRGAALVVSAGTAVTLDAIDTQGNHLGGYIVPGLQLMQRSLGQGTAEVQVAGDVDVDGAAGLEPGRSTREAVQRGLIRMVVGLVDRGMEEFTNVWGIQPRLFICGGDASILAAHLKSPYVVAADLVLDGLDVALP